jgi:peptidoglycan-associated lipoprotein
MNKIFNVFAEVVGGLKAGKKKTMIRQIVAVGLASTCFGIVSPVSADFESEVTLKLGVSGLYNHRLLARQAIVGLRQMGGHVSADFTVPGHDIALSPFLNIYHRVQNDVATGRPANDSATNMMGGVNFLFSGFNSERATIYMGLGGGLAHFKVVNAVNLPLPTTSYNNKLMATGLVGLELKISENISFFVEPHYVWTTKMLNGFSTNAGLAIQFNQHGPTPQAKPVVPAYVYEKPIPKVQEPVKMEPIKAEPIMVEPVKVSSAKALATMQEMIYFKNNRSNLSDSAKVILNNKVPVFRANPAMRIVIVGFASQPGTEVYNMALGLKRAEAAKDYLVSQGIDAVRIEIATEGEGHLAVEGPGQAAAAANRRGQFRLLIADPFLEEPK